MQRQWIKVACLLVLPMAAANAAWAEENYPNGSVRLISDSSPGSAVDTGLRIIAEGMSQHWKQQVVLVNQPGAAGAISASIAAQAAPDGYTLYGPALSVFLAVPGKAPNLPLKSKPGELSYAVTGVGRLTHLTGELLQLRTGIKLQMVPYSGNSAQAVADVFGGRIAIMIEGYTGLAPAFQSGNLVPLAVGAAKRLPSVPDLPTISETVPGLIASGWQAVLTQNGTPEPIVAKASEGLRAALNMANVKEQLAGRGSFARPMSPQEVTAFIRDQQALWKPAIERLAQQMK
jgi:tripartite-type tricarboxylate transporter receptor subunit TctC